MVRCVMVQRCSGRDNFAWARRFLFALTLLAMWAPGCRRNEFADKPPGPATQQQMPAAPRLDLTPGDPEGATRFVADPFWTSAATRHEIELLRLADREGAAGLLEGVEAGRTVALTALAALPGAGDAALALGRLCELLEQTQNAPHPAVLEAVHGIVARLPEQREAVATDGY